MEKKISVIIPAYNVDKYIRRCLDSLVNQTYKNLEIIVVNDASTDRTGEIIAEYVERFPEMVFSYEQKKNAGQAAARNLGIARATGEYIGFVDSDDFVDSSMYEKMYMEAEETGCDLVTCGYFGCDVATGEISGYQLGFRGEFNQSIYENPHILRINSPYPWNKLYAKELLDRTGFQFPEGMIFEDLCAVLPLFLDVKKVGRVHEKLYYYMKGRKGGTLSTFNERHGQIVDALQRVNDVYRERGEFERFYDTLLFFNIRHIFARFDEMENYQNTSFKKKFTKRAYELLDGYFPSWRVSEEFAAFQSGALQEGSGEKEEADIMAPEEDDAASKKRSRKAGRTAAGAGKSNSKDGAKKRSELFEEFVSEKKVKKGAVLIKCYHGNDIRGACYYIGKLLAEDKRFDYTVYVAAMDSERVQKFEEMYGEMWHAVDMASEQYVELLATAEYIVTNRGVVEYYRKRKGQKYIFTDFMPSVLGQGKEVTYGTKNMQSMQFGLAQADAILFPLELKDEFVPLLERYNMEEICRDKGVFVSVSEFFRSWGTSMPDVGGEGKRIAYLPPAKVFPGLEDSKYHLFLSDLRKKLIELDELISDGTKILVYFPKGIFRRFRERQWKHIEFLPAEAEITEILAGCQGMIGGYGPELYLMKALGKPVCRFVTDEADVAWSQGIARKAGAEFEVFDSAGQAAEWVNAIKPEEETGEKNEPGQSDGLYSATYQEVFRRGRGRKNKKHKRKVVYIPECKNKKEFDTFVHRHDRTSTLFLIEKRFMDNHMAAWLKQWEPDIRYIVIMRSFVISRDETRLVKYRLTTKDKLKEKRDKERYGV